MTEAEVAALQAIIEHEIRTATTTEPEALSDKITQRLVADKEFYYLPQKLPGE